MLKILAISLAICTAIGCNLTAGGDRLLGEAVNQVAPTPTRLNIQNIQISPGTVLPPYGLKVKADQAFLRVTVSSDKDEPEARLEDLQQIVEQIAARAAEDEVIGLETTSINQVSESSERGISSSYAWSGESSAVTLKLTTPLTETNDNLLESLVIFNNFLGTLDLPETITLQAWAIGSEISDPELYRPQLIAKIYQELDAVQAEYGEAVKFEITGLHGNLQTLSLGDTEYYLYLEPAIVVREF